jgi:hypothetical protein
VLLARLLELGSAQLVAGAAFVTIVRVLTVFADTSLLAALVLGAGVVLSVGVGVGDVVGVLVGVGVMLGVGVGLACWPGVGEQVGFAEGVVDVVPAPDGAMAGGATEPFSVGASWPVPVPGPGLAGTLLPPRKSSSTSLSRTWARP